MKQTRSFRALLATALAGSLFLLLSYTDTDADDSSPLLRHESHPDPGPQSRRQLLSTRTGSPDEIVRRENCQIVYVLGVEGAGHQRITPILKKLIERQSESQTGSRYVYHEARDSLVQKAVFGHMARRSAVSDLELVNELLRSICPNDGARHVLLLDTSFPSKSVDRGSYYRVGRQKQWTDMGVTEIAESETALNHPVNLRQFYKAYSPHADVRFVALSQPLMVSIAEHPKLDGGPEQHTAVMSGYLLLLRQFLDWLGRTAGKKNWTLLCMEELSEQFHHGNMAKVVSSHTDMVRNIAHFLGWPVDQCVGCLPDLEAKVVYNSTRKLEGEDIRLPLELINMKKEVLKGIWPPPPPSRWHRRCSA
ncbi:hypothetical protein ACHAWF_013674 [Thalassiosira exigua]